MYPPQNPSFSVVEFRKSETPKIMTKVNPKAIIRQCVEKFKTFNKIDVLFFDRLG